jgi:hypothetical protein
MSRNNLHTVCNTCGNPRGLHTGQFAHCPPTGLSERRAAARRLVIKCENALEQARADLVAIEHLEDIEHSSNCFLRATGRTARQEVK